MKCILAIFLIFILFCYIQKEPFQMYNIKPFNYKKIGTEPLNYYVKKKYRKPYRYPYQFKSTFPMNHMSYNI